MDIKHGFTKGLNRDISKNKFPNDAYYYLLNGRVLADDDATMSDIINLKGNTAANITNPNDRDDYVIIGYCNIANDIVLFYAEDTATGSDDYNTIGIIDKLTYDGNDAYTQSEIWNGVGLNFRIDKKIRAIGRIEDADITKIYWTDNNETFKYAHLENITGGSIAQEFDSLGYTDDLLEPGFIRYTSGSLKPGMIYYSYRFLKRYGSATKFTAISEPIPIGRNVDNANLHTVKGDAQYNPDTGYDTGMGVQAQIVVADSYTASFYDTLEVVSLWQSSGTSIPDITIVSRIPLDDAIGIYSFTDDGTTNYGSIEYSEFLSQLLDFKAKDLVTKDNRLFIGNITENTFDIDTDATWAGKSPGDIWDARAYRFDAGRSAELLEGDYATIHDTINGAAPDYTVVGDTEDCINIYNKITSDLTDSYNSGGTSSDLQKYKADGTTLGGEGLNISYTFYTIPQEVIGVEQLGPSMTKPNTQEHLGFTRGFQRDEVYRFGIVFFDAKGRSSFTKWVGDIRMPRIVDGGLGSISTDVSEFNSGTGYITGNTLHILFNVTGIPTLDGNALQYSVVYVPREKKDKSILYTGIATHTINDDPFGTFVDMPPPFPTSILMYNNVLGSSVYGKISSGIDNKRLLNIQSPEISFNDTEYYAADFLEVPGIIEAHWTVNAIGDNIFNWEVVDPDDDWNDIGGGTTIEDLLTIRKMVALTPSTVDIGRLDVLDQIKSSPPLANSFVTTISTNNYTHWYNGNGGTHNGVHGSTMTIKTDTTIDNGDSRGAGYFNTSGLGVAERAEHYLYTYGRQEVFTSQYGGPTYENRSLNIYKPSHSIQSAATYGAVWGDTFVTMFEYQNVIRRNSGATGDVMETDYIMCETSINCLLRDDTPWSKTPRNSVSRASYVNEDTYIDPDIGVTYPALYGYNAAYSRTVDAISYFIKPADFKADVANTTMIKYSEVRFNNEDSDSWLDFKTNNYQYGDAIHGPINRLIEFNNNVLSFQDNAVALIPINSKATTQSDDGVSITLGTGAVIDDFRYITTDIGCQDNSDIVKSLSALYWLDKNKKKIYTFSGQMQSVSDIKGIHSYLKNNIYENSYFTGTYDINNSEVLMTIYDNLAPNSEFEAFANVGDWDLTGDTTLLDYNFVVDDVYKFNDGWFRLIEINASYLKLTHSHGTDFIGNDIVDMHMFMTERDNFTIAFNEKIQAFTSFYSFLPSLYISHNRDFFTSMNDKDLWHHNNNSYYNDFYGTSYPTILKFITLNNSVRQGEYNNINFFTELKDLNGDNIRNETMTNISASNNYQNSNDIILYPMHLPEDTDRTKYVLDTSSDKIGLDWYLGLVSPFESLRVYENELYRCINVAGHAGPPVVGANWVIAELSNIRKTIDHWNMSLPRITNYESGFPEDDDYPMSDRLRSGWSEITLELKDTPASISLNERKLKLSDIVISSEQLLF